MESSLAFAPDFSKSGGLIAAVAQDAETLDVLMLAWMNPEAWEKTLETGEAHYYSRSRKCLWHKGGTSGHVQKVKSIRLDCDGDAVVLLIEQIGGAACMKGTEAASRVNSATVRFPAVPNSYLTPKRCTMANPILKLGLPKGSLEDPTIDLFDRAGWKVRKHPRNYFPDINDPEITARLCRVQEIPLYIQDGVLDLGLTGKDWVKETKADVVVVSDLIYSKVSNKPARWVLAVADDSPYQKPEDLAGKRIATELMGVCTEYFKERNIPVNINYSWGATEAKVVEGLADAIVEVTETETTIRAHDLRVIDEVLVTNTVLIANAAAMQDPEKRRKIEQIDLLLQGALRAESLVCLKMNAPAAKLDAVLALLPSLNSPTVAPLQNGEWLSLETVVSTGIVRDLIPQLREAGAEGILEYALNKVI